MGATLSALSTTSGDDVTGSSVTSADAADWLAVAMEMVARFGDCRVDEYCGIFDDWFDSIATFAPTSDFSVPATLDDDSGSTDNCRTTAIDDFVVT